MQSSTRVIFNTGVQYVRTFITVCIALYSSRLILQYLGENDYGIYSLVGGIITMLAFINSSLASTAQRYLSFYQGSKNMEMQRKVFNNSIFIQIVLGILLVIVLYFLTPAIFGGFLNITPDKIKIAKMVYYSMIVSVFFSMISTPYIAALIAHENILYTSVIQIVEAILKLAVAISLAFIFYDRLGYYALMVTGLNAFTLCAYAVYCNRKYEECKSISFRKFDVPLLKEIFAFSGWTMYSTGCIVGRTQGIAIILNRFFGTVINAAYGIAFQLQGHLSFISGSLMNAIKPQIMKAEGNNDRKKMLRLSEIASKFSFLLLAIVVVPAVFEMKTLLALWLKEVPDYTVVFAQFVLITTLVDQLTTGLGYANQAIGNIKYYSLTINTIKLLTLPVAYFCLRAGLPPVSVMVCMVVFEFICSISRLFFLKKTGGLLIKPYIKKVFIPEIIPMVCVISVCWLSHRFLPEYLFFLSFLFSMIVLTLSVYFSGLCDDEKIIIHELLQKMNIKTFVKKCLPSWLVRKIRYYYWIKRPKKLSEAIYFSSFGKPIDWKNPKDFNEKIHWLKFYSDTSQWSELADKWKVREYVAAKGFPHLLNELYAKFNSINEIDISTLPDSFVLKMNNGYDDILMVHDKSQISNRYVKKHFREKRKIRYDRFAGETHYLKIKPCIIAEKLLVNSAPFSSSLVDYKFLCFNGNVKYIEVVFNRAGTHVDSICYDLDWNPLNYCLPPVQISIPRPKSLETMIQASKLLSQGFPFVRVDFYEVNGAPVFGEMTFTPGGGFLDCYIPEFLEELGGYIEIP